LGWEETDPLSDKSNNGDNNFTFPCEISAMTDEQSLIEKLRQMEARFATAAGPGENATTADVVTRILNRFGESDKAEPPREYRFSMPDRYSRSLFNALLRRYKIQPYRYRGQRQTTVMARVTKRFVDDVLWPEYLEMNRTLQLFLDEVTRRVIERAVHADASESEERAEPLQLPGPG